MNGPRRHRVSQHRCMERTCGASRRIYQEMKETLYRVISQNSYMGRHKRSKEISYRDHRRQHHISEQCEQYKCSQGRRCTTTESKDTEERRRRTNQYRRYSFLKFIYAIIHRGRNQHRDIRTWSSYKYQGKGNDNSTSILRNPDIAKIHKE